MKILVIAENDGAKLRKASLSALSFAREIAAAKSASIEVLNLGSGIETVGQDSARFAPTLLADAESLASPLADRYAKVIASVVQERGVTLLVAASTGWAKDIVGRAAGLLGGCMASDVVGHEFVDGSLRLTRPMFAGEALAQVVLHGAVQTITVRGARYDAADALADAASVEAVDVSTMDLPGSTEYRGLESKPSSRPDATEASIVVSGGRAFKSGEDFEGKVGGLADKLGGAVGASRALVDEGLVPNELQIGQTGKIVAPDLYVALGLSGAIQHLAGISGSKVIAAINKDPEAPIFTVANYGLVADVHEAVPEFIEKL